MQTSCKMKFEKKVYTLIVFIICCPFLLLKNVKKTPAPTMENVKKTLAPTMKNVKRTLAPTTKNISNKYAYVFLSYGNPLPALKIATSCKSMVNDTNIDIIIARLGTPLRNVPDGVQQRMLKYPKVEGHYQWKWSFAKFYPALWYEYKTVIVLDTDTILFKAPNHFLYNGPAPNKVFAPEAYWLDHAYYSSGFLVFAPYRNTTLDQKIRNVLFGSTKFQFEDMDWFNRYLKDHIDRIDSSYTMLTGEFEANDGIYAYHAKKWNVSLKNVLERTYLVHAVANWKPWQNSKLYKKNDNLKYIFNKWNNIKI